MTTIQIVIIFFFALLFIGACIIIWLLIRSERYYSQYPQEEYLTDYPYDDEKDRQDII